jgi:putative transposase
MDLKEGDLFEMPDGLYRLSEEGLNGILRFRRQGLPKDLDISRDELELMHGRGEAWKVDFFKTRNEQTGEETPQKSNDNEVFGPHEEFSPDAVRAKTLQFYVRAWDKDGSVGLGQTGLKDFIEGMRYDAQQKKHTYDVKPCTLWRAIRNCGAKDERPLRAFRSRKGRTSRRRLDDLVHQMLDDAVVFYWSERGRDYNDAQALFRTNMAEENSERRMKGVTELKFPKRMETLRRRINAAINHANWARKYSKPEADQKFNGIRESLQADKPLELVIMDHTPVDTWTVLDTETYIPLGRATLTVAIDVATRMILGHLLSFEPPSLFSVQRTLQRVNRNKRYIAKVFPDIPGTSDAWGHPETILVDNGLEFVGTSFQDSLADLGTEIIWAPVRTPQYKAVGERFFHTLNTMLLHKLKGGVPYDPKTMRQVGLDPREEAIITLGDLDSLIHHAIIVYQNERHDSLDAIPARIWKEKIARHGRRYIPDVKQLDALLGRVETGRLSNRGIKFKNMVFHDPKITKKLLAAILPKEAKRGQSQKKMSSGKGHVKFKWNPIDASKIDVWNHGAKKRHYVPLPNRDKKFSAGLSFWHAQKIREWNKVEDNKFQTDEQKWQARNALREHWEKVAGMMPFRDSRDARRGLAQTSGLYEEADTTDAENRPISDSEVLMSSDDAPLVPADPPAYEREDHMKPPAGLPESKAARKTADATRKERKAEAAEEKKRNARKKRQREASGKPTTPTTGTKSSYAERLLNGGNGK